MSPPSPGFASSLEHGGWSSAALFAGRPFHLVYESISLQLLILGDLPSMIASIPAALLLFPFNTALHVGLYKGSYEDAAILLLLSSFNGRALGMS
jgi:hypothetical protein